MVKITQNVDSNQATAKNSQVINPAKILKEQGEQLSDTACFISWFGISSF